MLKSEFVDVVANVMQTSKAKAKVAVDGVFEQLSISRLVKPLKFLAVRACVSVLLRY